MRALLLILFALLSFPAFSSPYIKVANNGTDLPDSALLGTGPGDWACTRDSRSGLLWEVKTNDYDLHSYHTRFTNYDNPNSPQKWNANPTQAEIDALTNSIGFMKTVNASGFCGHSDWRMPGKDELANLLDDPCVGNAYPDPYVSNPSCTAASYIDVFFPNGPPNSPMNITWSSVGGASASSAWTMDFEFQRGNFFEGARAWTGNVVLVRGEPSFASFAVSLQATGSGDGKITGNTGGIYCPSGVGVTYRLCTAKLANNTLITLTATAGRGSRFVGWSGACAGADLTCTLTMDATKNASAAFAAAPPSQYSKIANSGAVLPDSAALGGAVGWVCTRDNVSGLLWEVKINNGSYENDFRDERMTYTNYDDPTEPQKEVWNGSAYENVNPTQAEIDAPTNTIGFAKRVNALGLCGQSNWRVPSLAELASLRDKGYSPLISPVFFPNHSYGIMEAWLWGGSYWSSTRVDLYLDSSYPYGKLTGQFYLGRFRDPMLPIWKANVNLVSGGLTLSLAATGSGSGKITSNLSGINCTSTAGTTSGTCSTTQGRGMALTLMATPSAGSTFTGWRGACSGTSSTCTLTMDTAKSVTANFRVVATLAPYTDNSDGTVSDPRTGLTWMRCAMGQTWTGSTCSGTASTYPWAAAVALSGAISFAGKSDWRLPNIRELQSIADPSTYNPAINTTAFPNTLNCFWSASSYAPDPAFAWAVYFYSGYPGPLAGSQSNYCNVRLVRSGQSPEFLNLARPTASYVDQGNGTATHTPSGLIWKRCAEGQTWSVNTCAGTASTYSWEAAQALSSPFAGQSDWRLPTAEELLSLADYTISAPAINATLFPLTPSSYFWSASFPVSNPAMRWGVYFFNGDINAYNQSDKYQVRLVRGGQSFDTFALSLSSTGSGSGALTGSPGGLNCASTAGTSSGTCSASLASGTVVTLTASPAAGSIFVGWSGACSGTTTTCSLTMDAVKNVTANFNSAALAAQTITFGPAPTVTVGNTGLLSATATSGLLVTISSNTLDICTVSGSTVRGVTAGYCTLAANQAGNSSFSPAASVMQSFSITAAAPQPPSPPTNVLITAGQGSAMINFSAPSGSNIAYYTASCAAIDQTTRTATGSTSPLTVKNLTGGVLYQCTLTATDSNGLTSIASASTPVTPAKKSSLTPILMLLLD